MIGMLPDFFGICATCSFLGAWGRPGRVLPGLWLVCWRVFVGGVVSVGGDGFFFDLGEFCGGGFVAVVGVGESVGFVAAAGFGVAG